MKQEIKQIVLWLRNKVEEANANGLLVGISGGLDSAVVAYLIKRAFPDNSLGVILPLNSHPKDLEDAQKVIEHSQIKHLTVHLTNTHNLLFGAIQEQLEEKNDLNTDAKQLADANLRARLRMSTLYTLSANYNYLVTGTDNKSEWYTGYFTKYGDGGVDLQPIIDYTKTETKKLAYHLGVPKEIIEKKPSADLWEGQTDEVEMGTTYEYIDAHIEGRKIPERHQKIIEQMHKQTDHKRKMPPKFLR